jgi:cytochrome P450
MRAAKYVAPLFRAAPPGARLAPLVKGDPLVGQLLRFRRDPIRTLEDIARHGEMVRVRFGPFPAHVISSPELVQEILLDRHRDFIKFQLGIRELRLVLGQGLLTSQGERWKRLRRTSQPAFHKREIDGFDGCFVRSADSELASLEAGQELDVHQLMMVITLRAVSESLLGADVRGFEDQVAESLDVILAFSRSRFLVPRLPVQIPVDYNASFLESREKLDGIVYRIIAESRASGPRENLISRLISAVDPETGLAMSTSELRDQILTFFLAGHETTANALSFTVHHLMNEPEIYARVLEEVDRAVGDRAPTSADLPALDLTRRVVEEAMRLHPPAWFLVRQTTQDETLGGYHVPANTALMIPPYLTHRNPRVWDDPLRFDPERFTQEARRGRPRFAYYPFGGGPRLCIGMGFALAEATLMLARLCQHVRLERAPGAPPVSLRPEITLRPEPGVFVKVASRRHERFIGGESLQSST